LVKMILLSILCFLSLKIDKEKIIDEFNWPSVKKMETRGIRVYKKDAFLEEILKLIENKEAACPIVGETRRTEPELKIINWIIDQYKHEKTINKKLKINKQTDLKVQDFPISETNKDNRTITTSNAQIFLIDDPDKFISSYARTFGNNELLKKINDKPIMLFEIDSITSNGRGFSGDPFTGQIAAYGKIFCYDMENNKNKRFVLYYPHQLYSQFYDKNGRIKNNKGIKTISHLVDLVITNNGILIDPYEWRVY